MKHAFHRIRQITALFLGILLLAGCGRAGKETEGQPAASTVYPPPDAKNAVRITDTEDKLLGQIAVGSGRTAVDGGVFYSRFEPKDYAATATAEYHYFNRADGRDILLGTLENQGYETVYARLELGGRIYTLALVGDPFDSAADTLWLLAFDPAGAAMRRYEVSRQGNPYAVMTAADGKILIVNHEMASVQYDMLYEFDPAAESVKDVLRLAGSVRGICPAENGFYLLRLQTDPEAALFLDLYDTRRDIVKEQPLDALLLPAVRTVRGILSEADAENELRMLVSGFAVRDGRYLFYENFGLARLAVDLNTGEVLLAEDDLWCLSKGSGEPLFYRMEFEAEETKSAPKILALMDGALRELSCGRPDGLFLRELSCSADGSRLLFFAGSSPETSLLRIQEEK